MHFNIRFQATKIKHFAYFQYYTRHQLEFINFQPNFRIHDTPKRNRDTVILFSL